jgi:uncharacterized protein (UPF0335 family)
MAKKAKDLFDAETGEVFAPPTGSNATLAEYIARLNRIDEERKLLTEDMSEIIKEAHRAGHDGKALRKAFSMTKMAKEDRQKLGAMLDEVDFWS